jgi:hypothetical protein
VIAVKEEVLRRLTLLEEAAAGVLVRRPVIRRATAAMAALRHRALAEGVLPGASARTGVIPKENGARTADK